jgi:hypothetical protein
MAKAAQHDRVSIEDVARRSGFPPMIASWAVRPRNGVVGETSCV